MTAVHSEPPNPTVDPTVLEADRAKIQADLLTMTSDYKANSAALAAARAARDAHKKASDALLKTLTTKKCTDNKALAALQGNQEKALAAFRAKWGPIVGPLEKDVKTDTPGETEEERASDAERLAAYRVQLMADYTAITDKTKADRASLTEMVTSDKAAIDAAKAAALEQLKADAAAVSAAEKAMQTTFNSDRAIVLADFATYRSHGGNVDALKIKLPGLESVKK